MRQNTLRILVVDDKPAVLMTYKLILQQQGHDVVGVTSCEGALTELADASFDLLLCDYTLEDDRNGFHVIDEARQKVPGIRSLLMTGYGEDEVGVHAAERGVKVLFKPVNVTDLLNAVSDGHTQRAIA
jgi:DNA-binding NtrC family response regulator